MADTTVKKVNAAHSPQGDMGQVYLVSGKRMAMRLWEEQPGEDKASRTRDYETVGYVIAGRAELHLEGQQIRLEPGDAWVVPEGAEHTYRVLEDFKAVETTSPPARIKERDEA